MRLFPPKSGPKHTFHNFQLIELLRLRFVRRSSLLPPPSAVGRRSFSLMRKFMNIFYKMNSVWRGIPCKMIDRLFGFLSAYLQGSCSASAALHGQLAGLLITVARPRSMAIYIILIFTRRPCGVRARGSRLQKPQDCCAPMLLFNDRLPTAHLTTPCPLNQRRRPPPPLAWRGIESRANSPPRVG